MPGIILGAYFQDFLSKLSLTASAGENVFLIDAYKPKLQWWNRETVVDFMQ